MSSLPRSCQRVREHLQSSMRTAPKKAYTKDHVVRTAPGLEDVASPQAAPSFSKDGYVAAIEQQANNWRDFAAEMSCRLEGVKSELYKAVKENALELDRHQRISAEDEERSSSSISSLNTNIVELQGAASGLQATIASKESAAAAADIKYKEELETLHVAHCAQTQKLSQIQAEMDREQQATREELEHAQTALAQQQNAVADAQAQVHLANQRVQALDSDLTSSQQGSMNVTTDLESEVTHLKTLLVGEAGKTKQAQQQHEAAKAESAAQLANLKSRMDTELAALTNQLEAEQKRRVAAEEQHKAAQADLALASGAAEQLKSDQAVLLTKALRSEVTISELNEQAAQLQAALNAAHSQNDEAAAVAQHTQGQQQQMDLDMADLDRQLESERRKCSQAAFDHEAAQADLAKQLTLASEATQKLKSQNAELAIQAMKDALAVKELTNQAAQLRAALPAARAKSAAAGQRAQMMQMIQELNALRAEHAASVDDTQVVYAKLEAAKLKISTMKAQLITSHEAADSARAAADSLAEQMRTSANTDLSKVTEAAKLLLLLENSQANVVSTEQQVKRFEQQLAGSQTAAAQLKAALTAANNKAGAEAAAAAQQAQVHQQQLDALLADQPASAENTRVVLVELEAAKLQVSTLKAQLIASHEAADSARAASDSLTQQMKTSAETELSKGLQKVNAAEAEVQHLQCRLANTQAGAQSEAAKLLLVLDKSRAKQEEEFKKVHQKELQAEGLRRWEDLFRQAAQLRTDLRVAKAKAQDEAQEAADYASQLSQQNFALTDSMQELQEQLKREGWRALQPEVQAEQEISKLQEQLAAAQVTDEAAQQGVKRLEQEVKRLEQQLAGSQTATAPKEQELVATLVALTYEHASKLQGQLKTALMDLNSLPGVVRSAWFERNRMTAILEAICDDREHSQGHMVTQVEAIQKLVDALASSCKSVRSELRDAQVDRNRTNSQLENARVKKNESQGQLESATEKYQRLKGQFDKQRSALADLSNQQEQEQHHDAEQLSTELVESQVVQSSPSQQANQEARGLWEDAQHVQQQHFRNSHTLDRNSPQGPPVRLLATHSSASILSEEAPVMGAMQQQQRLRMKEARGPWEDAQHIQQQRFPNNHTLDWNSPQGPPVHSPATHSSGSMVGGNLPEIGAQQQQQQCPLMAPTLDLPPGFQQQSIFANHAAAQAGDNAVASGQEDGDCESAALEAQQRPKIQRGVRAGRVSRQH